MCELNWNKYVLFLQTVEKSDIDLLSIQNEEFVQVQNRKIQSLSF